MGMALNAAFCDHAINHHKTSVFCIFPQHPVASFGAWLHTNRTPNTNAAGGLLQLATLLAILSCPTSENKMNTTFFKAACTLFRAAWKNIFIHKFDPPSSFMPQPSIYVIICIYIYKLCIILLYHIESRYITLQEPNAEQTTAQMAANGFHTPTTLEAVEVPATSNYRSSNLLEDGRKTLPVIFNHLWNNFTKTI